MLSQQSSHIYIYILLFGGAQQLSLGLAFVLNFNGIFVRGRPARLRHIHISQLHDRTRSFVPLCNKYRNRIIKVQASLRHRCVEQLSATTIISKQTMNFTAQATAICKPNVVPATCACSWNKKGALGQCWQGRQRRKTRLMLGTQRAHTWVSIMCQSAQIPNDWCKLKNSVQHANEKLQTQL